MSTESNQPPRKQRTRRRPQDLDLVLLVIHLYRQKQGRSPDQRWLMQALGFSSTQPITRRLKAIEELDLIRRLERRPYNIELTPEGLHRAEELSKSEVNMEAQAAMNRADGSLPAEIPQEQRVGSGT